MINFRIIRVKDILKWLVKLGILIIGIVIFTSLFNMTKKINFNEFIENRKRQLENKTFLDILKTNLDDKNIKNNIDKQNILSSELNPITVAFIPPSNDNSNNQMNEEMQKEELSNIVEVAEETSDVQKNVETKVVTEHNLNNVYNIAYNDVQIRNQTSINLTQDMLVPDVQFNKQNIIIFHTHTSESYTPSEKYQYVASGNYRTLDKNASVVGVGNELTSRLVSNGFNVVHDSTFHDYPEYNGAYTRSLQTVQSILNNSPSDIVIDLHRDAIADEKYAPSVMIGDEKVAQLMFVMGSNEGGLSHPNWLENLKIAIKIQAKANEMYPGLFRPILLSKYRYNEHVAKGACIIEVGATGNTLEECLGSMKYLAEVLNEV